MSRIDTNLFGSLAFLPYQAMRPFSQSFEWLTDVLTSYNGTESRSDKRSKPRIIYNYKFPLQSVKKSSAFNAFYGAARVDWAIPTWNEIQSVGPVTAGDSIIICDTTDFDLRSDSLAMIFTTNGDYEVVEIETATVGQIEIYGQTVNTYSDALLVPVRQCFINGKPKLLTTGYESDVVVAFQLTDSLEIIPSEPDQYLGNDIYFIESLSDGQQKITKEIDDKQILIDYKLGNIDQFGPWAYPRYGSSLGNISDGFDELKTHKDFLYRRAGRFRAYWSPTFESDVRLQTTGLITNILSVDSDSIIDHMQDRTHIAVRAKDGIWYPREITNFLQVDPATVQLTITPDLNVQGIDVDYISYLGLNRLGNDRITLNWAGNNVVRDSFPIVELSP